MISISAASLVSWIPGFRDAAWPTATGCQAAMRPAPCACAATWSDALGFSPPSVLKLSIALCTSAKTCAKDTEPHHDACVAKRCFCPWPGLVSSCALSALHCSLSISSGSRPSLYLQIDQVLCTSCVDCTNTQTTFTGCILKRSAMHERRDTACMQCSGTGLCHQGMPMLHMSMVHLRERCLPRQAEAQPIFSPASPASHSAQ